MTHAFLVDDMPHSPTQGLEVPVPVTVLEAPPLKVLGVRVYKPTPYGRTLVQNGDGTEVRLTVATQPGRVTGVPSKAPDTFEVAVGGGFQEALAHAKGLVGKELKAADVLAEGEFVDVSAVTKGKGTQGPVKRWGVMMQPDKAARSSRSRHVGSLGPWHPSHVTWRVPQLGQMGYHQRTEYRKRLLKIGANGADATPGGGFSRYGVVRGDYLLVEGSVPGPRKRLVRLRPALRPAKSPGAPQITYVSRASQQGVRPRVARPAGAAEAASPKAEAPPEKKGAEAAPEKAPKPKEKAPAKPGAAEKKG
jgi:large subunit ribosomal protein L3